MPLFKSRIIHCLCWGLLCLVIYGQSLSVHGIEYRDDEIFYYEASQEMVRSGDYLSPTYFGQDRFQKPVLFYWLVIAFFKIFGPNWFAARLVSVVFAAGCVVITWMLADEFFDRKTANLSALILMIIPLFFRHAKNAVPDMALNFFIVLSLWAGIKFIQNPTGLKPWFLFFVSAALGFLIKGFAAFIIPFGTIIFYLLFTKNFSTLRKFRWVEGMALVLLIVLPWFIYMIKTHGKGYVDYMLVEETQKRLVGGSFSQAGYNLVHEFFDHASFFLNMLFSYFMPWSPILIFSAIQGWRLRKQQSKGILPFQFLWIWLLWVMLFFSSMHVVISHYILVLTTPFALLVGYRLTHQEEFSAKISRFVLIFQKIYFLFWLTVGVFAFSFLVVFLAGYPKFWLSVCFLGCAGLVYVLVRKKEALSSTFVLGAFIAFVFSQTGIMEKAGITAHSALYNFAQKVNAQKSENAIVAVGSHDIHEKEFQVYFDQPVMKVAQDTEVFTISMLNGLLQRSDEVYCLITEYDYNRYLSQKPYPMTVVLTQSMIRKRMAIDGKFFFALLRLDQATVVGYLKENVLLIHKEDTHG